MALYQTKPENISKVLDDWYGAEKKEYEKFADAYPLNGELIKQGKKLEAMYEWSEKTNIEATPTFFIDGYQLPGIYKIEDLKHLL